MDWCFLWIDIRVYSRRALRSLSEVGFIRGSKKKRQRFQKLSCAACPPP